MQSFSITTPPALEPVTLAEVKLFCRIDVSTDDSLILDLITAARTLAEDFTRRKFITTEITLTLDGFPLQHSQAWWDGVRQGAVSELVGQSGMIVLPFPPSIAVTSLTTYDEANAGTVYSSANYRLDQIGGRIYLNTNQQWPVNLRDYNGVQIVYTAGYGLTPGTVPMPIRQAIKMTVAAMYEDRTCFEMPAVAKAALQPYRVIEERSNRGM